MIGERSVRLEGAAAVLAGHPDTSVWVLLDNPRRVAYTSTYRLSRLIFAEEANNDDSGTH
jgi:hypothetical protein